MTANKKLLFLPGDGIGPEVMGEVRKVIDWLDYRRHVSFEMDEDLVGGAAIDAHGTSLTDATLDKAMNVDTTNAMVVEVYAKQFDWTARYSGEDNKLGYANYKLVEGPNQLGVDLEDINAHDDIVTKEIHLIKDKQVLFKFRSQDVIHSAFLPHFRVQMNCVPGMITQFAFTPTKTTNEMKEQEGEDFEYILLCNKICGAAHYNMQIKVIVETQEEYDNWINQQKILKNTLTLK